MAISPLTHPPDYAALFRQRVVVNARYWQNYVAERTADVEALDSERGCILKAVSFALELEPAWPYAYDLIVSFAPYIEKRGYWQAWNQFLGRAIELAQAVGDTNGAVTLSLLLARLLQRQTRLAEAVKQYRQVIHLARQSGDQLSEARACSNLGYLYTEQGYWHRAEVLCRHALSIFESLDNDHGRAHTENHLGFLYTRTQQWAKAQHHLEQACAFWQANDDNHGLMRGFINLSLLYNEREQPDQTLFYLGKALQQAELTGEESEVGTIYMNIGVAYRLKGEPAQAERHAHLAEAIFRRFSNIIGAALVQVNLGAACLDQQKWPEAETYLDSALQSCRRLHHKYGEIKALMCLVEYELARKNQAQAAKRLEALEHALNHYSQVEHDPALELSLKKYRRSLAEQTTANGVS